MVTETNTLLVVGCPRAMQTITEPTTDNRQRLHRLNLSGTSTCPATRCHVTEPPPLLPRRKLPPTSETSTLPEPLLPMWTSLLTLRMSTEPLPSLPMSTLPAPYTSMPPEPSVMRTSPETFSSRMSPEPSWTDRLPLTLRIVISPLPSVTSAGPTLSIVKSPDPSSTTSGMVSGTTTSKSSLELPNISLSGVAAQMRRPEPLRPGTRLGPSN